MEAATLFLATPDLKKVLIRVDGKRLSALVVMVSMA